VVADGNGWLSFLNNNSAFIVRLRPDMRPVSCVYGPGPLWILLPVDPTDVRGWAATKRTRIHSMIRYGLHFSFRRLFCLCLISSYGCVHGLPALGLRPGFARSP